MHRHRRMAQPSFFGRDFGLRQGHRGLQICLPQVKSAAVPSQKKNACMHESSMVWMSLVPLPCPPFLSRNRGWRMQTGIQGRSKRTKRGCRSMDPLPWISRVWRGKKSCLGDAGQRGKVTKKERGPSSSLRCHRQWGLFVIRNLCTDAHQVRREGECGVDVEIAR